MLKMPKSNVSKFSQEIFAMLQNNGNEIMLKVNCKCNFNWKRKLASK